MTAAAARARRDCWLSRNRQMFADRIGFIALRPQADEGGEQDCEWIKKRGLPQFEAGPSARGSQVALGSHPCVALSSTWDKIHTNTTETKNHPLTGESVSGIGCVKRTTTGCTLQDA